jgi:hypothetical protein
MPTGLGALPEIPGVEPTADALLRLTRATLSTLDITAMYWSLLVDPASDDAAPLTDVDLAALGAGAGRALHEALRDAAARGVKIRIVQSPGFGDRDTGSLEIKYFGPRGRLRSGLDLAPRLVAPVHLTAHDRGGGPGAIAGYRARSSACAARSCWAPSRAVREGSAQRRSSSARIAVVSSSVASTPPRAKGEITIAGTRVPGPPGVRTPPSVRALCCTEAPATYRS